MADQKLTELASATAVGPSDLLYVVQAGISKKAAVSSLVSSIAVLVSSSYATIAYVTDALIPYATKASVTAALTSYTTNANLTSTLASFTVSKLQYSSLTVQLDSSGSVTFPNNAQIKDNANTSVSFGYQAGVTNQAANTIIFNASGSTVNGVSGQTNSFYVAPIRQFSSISAYATQRVLQYNESTKEITYSNTLDAVRPYITGYSSEIHVSPVALDDTGKGTIGDPVKTIAQAQVLAAAAFETTGAGERKTIVLHPGTYNENVTIDTQFTVLTTHELIGKNTTISGTVTVTKGCTIEGLKMTNLVISGTSAFGSVDIVGCTVSTAATKTSSAYVNFRACDLSTATLGITGAGSVVMIGGNYFTLTVNNVSAGVLAKAVVSMGPVTLTAGTLQLSDTLIYSATNTSNAITQSVGSVITVNNCQILIPALTDVARNSFGGFYSILHSVYDKPNSTFGGTSLNAISYSQYINADRLILSGVHEKFQAKTSSTGTVTHDCSSGHIFYHTSSVANWTANFTNLSLSSSYATTVTLVIPQGGTGYYPNAVQIGGAAQTILWQGNTTPTPSTNRTDVVTFSILNNSGTYIVLGQLTGF